MSCAQLLLVGTLLVSCSMASAWQAPAFCNGNECPKYTVVKQLGDGIELRRYEPSSWASTSGSGMDKESAMQGSFMKLFAYISCTNSKQAKIPMTSPVLTKIEPGSGPNCESTFTMSFYQPYNLQGANTANAPKPTGAGVSLTNMPALEVYVIPYGGFSTPAMERMKATELTKKLEAAKEPFSASVWYTAGYNSPYQLTNRHNEVWIPRTTTAAAAGSGSSGAVAADATAKSQTDWKAAGSGGDSKGTQTEAAKKAEAGK